MRSSLLLALLAGCASADAMTAAPAKPSAPNSELGLNPGETMAFDVHLGGVLAGEASLAVGEIGDYQGKRAIVVTSRAQTVGAADLVKHVVDAASTTIDVASGKPLLLDTDVETGDKKITSHATFNGSRSVVTYQKSDDPKPHSYGVSLGTLPVFDAHSAMAQLRGWRPQPGTTKQVFIIGGRRLWRVDVKVAGYETVGSALGNRKAVHFEGASYKARANMTLESDKPQRTFSVWLSDDGDRVPLKIKANTELGEIVMDLTEYQRP
jgi:hypothetical protein